MPYYTANIKNFNKKILIEIKDKKEIDKIFISENIVHQGVAAEIENIPSIELKEYLKKKPIINFDERKLIVQSCKYVDWTVDADEFVPLKYIKEFFFQN